MSYNFIFAKFLKTFFSYTIHLHAIIIELLILILLNSILISYFEEILFNDSIYFSFITSITIGFGGLIAGINITCELKI